MYRSTIVASLQITLSILFFLSWAVYLSIRIYQDEVWELLAFIICVPFAFTFTLFPINFMVNNLINLFYPTRKLSTNNKYYLSTPPPMPPHTPYPPITIQVPIYTEDFEQVVKLTLDNALTAAHQYPGPCNIVVCDDGLQVLPQADVDTRVSYYQRHGVGCIARPKNGRRGRFKKAGNLNTHLRFAQILLEDSVPQNDIIVGGDITIGQYIVLIDADSRIDASSLAHGVQCMITEPNIAFIQFQTDPLPNYTTNYFSRQIGRFTMNLYRIVFPIVCRGGEPAPLVGHNAMISADVLHKVRLVKETGDEYWREDRVSEDFDFSLRAQQAGYIGVYATFGTFQEGVSLTYMDELAKLSKFAYGASEIILSRDMIRYLKCRNIPWASKVNLCAYLFSYYAIASAILVAPFHMILTCYIEDWYRLTLEPIIVACFSFILFSVLGPLASISILYRSGIEKRWTEQITHGLFMFVFYTSVPFAVFQGVIAHLFRLPLRWGATRKTIDQQEKVWHVIYNFRAQYIVMGLYTLFIITALWKICAAWYGYVPICIMVIGHLINPVVMSPHLFTKEEVGLP